MNKQINIIIIALIGLLIFQNCVTDNAIKVMSFNIRYNNPDDGEFAWANRKEKVVDMIQYYSPDILGLQEALNDQIIYLHENLHGYDWEGVGRDDGKTKGEYSAVFFNSNRFELIKDDTFWLSETPEIAGSFGWDAACTRVVTWLILKDLKTDQDLYVFNTHFDHLGKQARSNSAQLLLSKVNNIAGDHDIVITGDFNAGDSSEVYQILTSDNTRSFLDTQYMSVSAHQGPNWTYQGFSNNVTKRKLDYIFVRGNIRVNYHEFILNPAFGKYPSDHLPVLTQIAVAHSK